MTLMKFLKDLKCLNPLTNKMSKKYFGTDGIRGKVNEGKINGEMFFKFGLAAGNYFKNLRKSKQVAIIAKDTRLSGYLSLIHI